MSVFADLSTEFDTTPEQMGAGMPRGKKRAGFIGLMIAKKHLRRSPRSYEPTGDLPTLTDRRAVPKSLPSRFDISRMTAPSAYVKANFQPRSLNRAFRAGERANLTQEQLAEVRAREAERQRQSRQRRRVRGGTRPTDRDFLDIVKTSYEKNPPAMVRDYKLIYRSPTITAWQNPVRKSIVLNVRGTDITNKNDLLADASLPFNRLTRSTRYIGDKAIVEQILQRYSPSEHEYYLTGHSLGGAIINQLKRDFPQLMNAVEYNPAFQPYDIISQQRGQVFRNYVSYDPLFRFGGRLFAEKKVVPPRSAPLTTLGAIGTLYNSVASHSLSNFEGAGLREDIAKAHGGIAMTGAGRRLLNKHGRKHRGAYHTMPDGSVWSGKSHTSRSQRLVVG